MTPAAISVRALGTLSAGLLALGMLAACTPQPEPAPEPTKTALFSSDAEAFKAAEQTYRAYVDASNLADYSNPDTFEAIYAWNTGTALGAEKKALTLYHAENLTRVGDFSYDNFSPLSASNEEVVVQLCVDVSKVDLLRSDGQSAVPEGRVPRVSRKVTFTPASTSTHLRIASNHKAEDSFSC